MTIFSTLFCYVTYVTGFIAIFSPAFCYVTPVTLLLSFNKKHAPGGDLIRVELIRFQG